MYKKIVIVLLISSLQKNTIAQITSFTTDEVTITVNSDTIYGTIFSPAGIKNPPIVLIIAGSGPTDRDGNSKGIPGKNNSLLQLADSLANHGIASLRYDKRGIGQSKVNNFSEENFIFADGIHDALVWFNFLKTKKYKKIFIAGHSEGSLIGMSVAKEVKVSGFISIAGAGRRIDEVLKEQLAGLPDSLKTEAFHNLDSLAIGKRIEHPNKNLNALFRPSVQPYLISWLQYNPQTIIHSLTCPVLIIQGENDVQVKIEDANALAIAQPKAQLLLIKDMNHVLKEVKSENRNENIKAYSNPDLPVMAALIKGMVTFIQTKK